MTRVINAHLQGEQVLPHLTLTAPELSAGTEGESILLCKLSSLLLIAHELPVGKSIHHDKQFRVCWASHVPRCCQRKLFSRRVLWGRLTVLRLPAVAGGR